MKHDCYDLDERLDRDDLDWDEDYEEEEEEEEEEDGDYEFDDDDDDDGGFEDWSDDGPEDSGARRGARRPILIHA